MMQYIVGSLFLGAVAIANPLALPQAVTAAISPSASPPPGCTPSYSASFGIAVHNLTTSTTAPAKRAVATQIADGQPQVATYGHVSMITDGQIQGSFHTVEYMAMQIGDGQVQVPTTTVMPVTQYSDGQPQAPTMSFVTPSATASATVTTVSETSASESLASSAPTTPPAPSTTEAPTTAATSASSSVPASSTGATQMVVCDKPGQLALTLNGGVLKDSEGRTGYIASNFQFQFDSPPQAGALFTSGFSTCSNGTLALGGSNIFYQCLSGNFYNLYDRSWAAQCSPVTISILMLQQCAT